MASHLDTITRYYDGCSAGDVDAMTATLHPDVVHYFLAPNPGSAPVCGAEHLARYWRKVQRMLHATWLVDHCLEGEREAVIEWTMCWVPPDGSQRVATRGAEWFTFRGGLIHEIRSYYRQEPGGTGLDAFPYLARGYSAPGDERHRAARR